MRKIRNWYWIIPRQFKSSQVTADLSRCFLLIIWTASTGLKFKLEISSTWHVRLIQLQTSRILSTYLHVTHSPLDYSARLRYRNIDWLADQLTDWLIDGRAVTAAACRVIICHAINIFACDADSFSKPHTLHPPFQRTTTSPGTAERPAKLINSATTCPRRRRRGPQATDWRWNGLSNVLDTANTTNWIISHSRYLHRPWTRRC